MEVVCRCDMENKYEIYNVKPHTLDPKGSQLFAVSEESSCSQRCFCRGPARGMTIKILHVSAGSDKDGEQFLECIKPCKCVMPLLCCNRPQMEVWNVEGN